VGRWPNHQASGQTLPSEQRLWEFVKRNTANSKYQNCPAQNADKSIIRLGDLELKKNKLNHLALCTAPLFFRLRRKWTLHRKWTQHTKTSVDWLRKFLTLTLHNSCVWGMSRDSQKCSNINGYCSSPIFAIIKHRYKHFFVVASVYKGLNIPAS
jgi:hypothetical protein